MKRVLVAGGAGGVGEGIVRQLLARGHAAIVPSRSAAKLAELRARLGLGERDPRLTTIAGDVGDVAGAAAVRDRALAEFGALDAAIASLGGWWSGEPLTRIPPEVFDTVMNEMLRTHFVFARTFVPVLQAQGYGRYIGIGGDAADIAIPLSGPVCMAAAAQAMMTRVMRLEIPEPAVDILELLVEGPVRTRYNDGVAAAAWISADEIGAVAADLVEAGRSASPAVTRQGAVVRMRATGTA